MKFTINNAIAVLDILSSHKPSIPYSSVYLNQYDVEADSDQEAINRVTALQQQHDLRYRRLSATFDDYNNSPCYLYRLYKVLDGREIKVG